MPHQPLELWQHQHTFNLEKTRIEKKTRLVVIITFAMMIAEIFFGWLTNSMALLADGWHMGTHAFALGISLIAYILARTYAHDNRFTFGTWKIEILGAYSSAIVLGMVGLLMIATSVERMIHPLPIQYNQALLVAMLGLVVNVVCAVILNSGGHAHGHHHAHEDLNLKSAYLHVIADAMTSVLALLALLGAKYLRVTWLDAFMGIVGAGLILNWSAMLLKETANILLDRAVTPLAEEVRATLESDGDTRISDLHLWKVAQDKYACIVAVVTNQKCAVDEYRQRLQDIHELAHITIEINH
ncbi:cation efflux system protein [Candidatus Moduliflexus flocculans]|uniref:Cation efflux system protein n=1 Tax=Candidatus Moduliflexus flocculans TaxID=1499966 RepID=A0A081BQ42_9BACT|nr:cation efflux system protein [Candidatus Moduliflexus flocculans]